MNMILITILFLGFCTVSRAAEPLCPVCNKKTFEVTTQKDDPSKPSKNIDVWNRSVCATLSYGKGSYICMNDGYAYDASLKTWKLKLNDRDGFAHPLVAGV
jgi:hypothetical protein